MTRKRLGKVLLVWLCIITLLMPFCSEVLAAALTGNETSTVVLESVPYREGGAESTGVTSAHYDTSKYAYKVADTSVLKITQADDATFADTFYCVNAERSLSVTSQYNYSKAADDFTKMTDAKVAAWASSVGISQANFNSLVYLLNNIYAKKLDTSYKNAYIANAFAERIEEDAANGVTPATTVDLVKEYLTDDDIEVIQQWAIWYFTNGSNTSNTFYRSVYANLGNIQVTKMTGINPSTGAPITETQDLSTIRQEYAGILYEYLIDSAKNHTSNVARTYPTIDKTNTVKMVVEGGYYKAGPFKIKSGNTTPDDFVAAISTEGGDLSSVAYKVTEDGVDVTSTFTSMALDKTYYIYLPIENNTITSVKLQIGYTPIATRKISLWTGVDDTQNLQPVVLLTPGPSTPVTDLVSATLEKQFDLSLKKFISSRNKTAISREPVVDVTPLKNGRIDATYTVDKNPVSVETGDLVTFTLRVYNEGDIAGFADIITDYIPEGLGFLKEYSGNSVWNSSGTTKLTDVLSDTSKINLADFAGVTSLENIHVQTSGKITTTSLNNTNNANLIAAFDGTGLAYKDVQVTFVVLATDSLVLKNIAAITAESDLNKDPVPTDRTSSQDSTPADDINPSTYTTGNEDDDDYDVVKVNKKEYDLALRKFIVSINGAATTGRTPVPTAASLEELATGSRKTAEYTHSKAPLTVKKGDRIVYEFRIYNEGEIDAKVGKIVDYLPEGLTVVSKTESTVNSRFNWDTTGGRTITNTYLAGTTINAFNKTTKNLSYGIVQLECEITGDLSEGSVLTNVAEILVDNGDDRDSEVGSIDPTTITNDYTGNTSNKDDLTDTNYYYKGLEDDDDFEKVIIEGPQFDLSLQKFVSAVNGKTQNRAPQVDVTPLKNSGIDAKYTVSKNPITVETGDIVTFTLRVYNEGDVDGYAEIVTDYIPEGLGFLVNYNTNYDNRWAISENSTSKKLSEVKNGTKNVKLTDFTDVESLDDVQVVLGKSKITSTALASSSTSTSNLIKAFDGSKLSYKDIQVAFIVVTEDAVTLKNIAAITKESNKDREPVNTDRDPEKDSTPKDDINPDKYTTGNEDDDDYDVVKTDKKNFDLALQKFISGLNNDKVTDRVPVVSLKDGKVVYTHPKTDGLAVGNGDLVEYTIRVYNEGDIDGYAAEIEDDIPKGLVFVTDNAVNKEYGWKMYDKSGKQTTDVKQAVKVKTTYLSKDSSESNLIKAFDGSTLMYKDVKLVFRIDETAIDKTVTTGKRTIINTAEITKNTDEDGEDIQDVDSTPGNKKEGEDDIDKEKVYVKYFDLALEKTLNKAIVTTKGQTTEVNGDKLKIEIHRRDINSTTIQFVYTIKVTNQGEIEGYATEITDYIPEGLSFNKASNPDWTQASDRIIKTEALAKTLLKPGESAEVKVVLDWVKSSDNIGRFVNVAEISEDWNPYDSDDVDSTPNNLIASEDDQDDAPVWIGIVTGLGDQPYIILTTTVLMILATGIILIKKYVLD